MKLFLFLTVIIVAYMVHGAKNPEDIKDPSKVMKQDLQYIKCEVCERAMAELIPVIDELKQEHSAKIKKAPIEEVKILEAIENVCKPRNDSGLWIRKLDISETMNNKKRYLSLVEPGGVSKCQSECLTIAQSCENLFENEVDIDDLSALLWKKSLTVDEAQEKVCRKLTKRCGQFPPAVSGNYKRQDYPFVPIPEKELEMEKLMASMKEMGLGGSMYGRDDLESMMSGGGFGGMPGMDGYGDPEGYEDVADEDDEPTRPGSNIEL